MTQCNVFLSLILKIFVTDSVREITAVGYDTSLQVHSVNCGTHCQGVTLFHLPPAFTCEWNELYLHMLSQPKQLSNYQLPKPLVLLTALCDGKSGNCFGFNAVLSHHATMCLCVYL